jgi:malate dehydrogenase
MYIIVIFFNPLAPDQTFSSKKPMFARAAVCALATRSSRFFSVSAPHLTKVAVLGAGGGIGQPLSLLLKIDPLVSSLSLYDIRGAPGVAADVGHVDVASEVRTLC